MLSPDYLETISDDILKIYDQLEDSILQDVIRRIVKTDYVTDTAKWQFEQLQNSGMVYQDAITQINKITGKSDAELKYLFEDAAVEVLEYDNKIYQAAGLTAIPLSQSPAMLQMLTAGLTKTSGTLRNLTMTTATAAQSAYINASNLAYMQVSSGAFSRTEAIKNAIKQAAWQGSSVLYPSGHVDKLDVAVRRATLTGVNQTMANVSIANMEDMGTDLVQVTAHSGARPSHAEWQGKVYSLSGPTEKYGDFYKETGYGTGDGLCGWNCRHNFYPFIEGVDEEMYSASDLEKLNEAKYEYNGKKYTEYEVTQMQRAKERKIRETRRELTAYDAAMKETLFDELKTSIKSDFDIAAVKLKSQESALKDLLKQTGIRNKTDRLQVAGFGKSISQRAVAADRAEYKKWAKSISLNAGGMPKSIDEYRWIKYNDKKEYSLIRGYVRAVDKGEISPIVGYDIYKSTAKEIETKIIGLTTTDGIEIKEYSTHFINRIIGQVSTPYPGKRLATPIEDVIDTILSSKVKNVRSIGEITITYKGNNCFVTVNPHKGKLIQTNPR